MLFNSLTFLVFMIATLLLYFTVCRTQFWQVSLLILASFVFYAWHTPVLLVLLIFSQTTNAWISFAVAHHAAKRARVNATIGVVLNLGVLVFFKYSGLLANSFFPASDVGMFLIQLPLPVGISFFTFQGISLLLDAYTGRKAAFLQQIDLRFSKHLINTMFFISFFPQLVAGPIVKAHHFYPQIRKVKFSEIRWELVFRNVVLGFFLKMVIADNLREQTFWIAYPYFQLVDSYSLIIMLFGYSMQIFADFAGYSLIAIGLARVFGYNLRLNFNYPYISSSFKEFWKRWHISLSSFLQEYLYIPLGGSRKGKMRMYFNLILTMFLGGLWHGASWSYAVWGLFHGTMLVLERYFNSISVSLLLRFVPRFVRIIFVFGLVSLAWLLFRLTDFGQALLYLDTIGDNWGLAPNFQLIVSILIFSVPIVFYHFHAMFKQMKMYPKVEPWYLALGYAAMLFLLFTNSGMPGEFIYFQF